MKRGNRDLGKPGIAWCEHVSFHHGGGANATVTCDTVKRKELRRSHDGDAGGIPARTEARPGWRGLSGR